MSIGYSAVVVVGLRHEDFPDPDQLESWADDGKIERVSPYYDASNEDCLFGVVVAYTRDYCFKEVPMPLDELEQAKDEFRALTGLEPKLWLSPHGS